MQLKVYNPPSPTPPPQQNSIPCVYVRKIWLLAPIDKVTLTSVALAESIHDHNVCSEARQPLSLFVSV
jgi:hypothetical protein